jgi:hypothetical protein
MRKGAVSASPELPHLDRFTSENSISSRSRIVGNVICSATSSVGGGAKKGLAFGKLTSGMHAG